MLTAEEGRFLVRLAKEIVTTFLKESRWVDPPAKITKKLREKRGVFLTLSRIGYEAKRETIASLGYPYPHLSLVEALVDVSENIALRTRLLPNMVSNVIEKLVFEVSVLTTPKLLVEEKPLERLKKIQLGQDGLLIEHGFFKGLFLPQVPVEMLWTTDEFISECCIKAGLLADAWMEVAYKHVKIYIFQTQSFTS